MSANAYYRLKFKEELGKMIVRELYGEDALAELEARKELKGKQMQRKAMAALVREMKLAEVREKMKKDALPEAARLVEDLENFLAEFGNKFDSYQEQVKRLQLQLVRTFLATQYLEKALSQLDDVQEKIRDMQSLGTVQELEEKIETLARRQRELVQQIREKVQSLQEELSRVTPELFSRKRIRTLEAKADLEALELLLEAELGQTKDQVERTFHHPLPAEPTTEEREVEEIHQGRRR